MLSLSQEINKLIWSILRMYTIEFYEKDNGESEIWELLETLRIKASTNKDARIQYKQAVLYIQLLQDN
jgi:hypothetical protein